MSGVASWKAKIELDIEDLRKQLLNAENSIDQVTKEDRKIKLDLDTKILESAIRKLDTMLDSLGKGTNDFKQFENLSSQLSSITKDINNIGKAFSSMNDGTELVNNIKSINASLTMLSNHFVSEVSGRMSTSIKDIKSTLSDVGDGNELIPLLQTINNIESAINNLSSSFKDIGLNMNINLGSDSELESKLQAKISNALQAYQRLFDHIKMSSAGGSIITQKFFDFDINQFDTPMSKLQAYKKFIENMRTESKQMFNGQDVLYTDTDKTYWTQASSAIGQVTKTFNEMKASANVNPLENIFGKTDLTEVIAQLGSVAGKLDEISVSAKEFTETFKNGLNVNASVEEIEKLTNRVKELESELVKIKTPTTSTPTSETNISSRNINQKKDAFSDSSTDTKPETQGMKQIEKATEEAVQAKKDFAAANEGVQSSIDGSENPLKLEAELMEQIAKSAREAADAKKEFVEANKQVKDSADKSNNNLADSYFENAEASGVKKYKKKGYKAHDTGNHDNEKKVSNKAELSKALKDLQSEIIASIDESTSFVKEITDFYDSQDNLVKTQMKVRDKSGSMRTYTTSYSMDKDGSATAWTSHIDTQKYQDQNKVIQEQIKILQKLSSEKQKVSESDRKSTVSQASKDQLEAWKQIQKIRKEIAGTSNNKLIEQLKQEKKSYQEQFLVATKILKNNSDIYNSEQRLNELKKISLKTTQQIESSQQRQLNGYDGKISNYQGKVSGYAATIDRFGKDGWTSPEYLQNVQKAQKLLKAYENEIDKLKANPDLVNKESLDYLKELEEKLKDATSAVQNMSAAQKGYTQLSGQKALSKINQLVKENSNMSRKAKNEIRGWYNQIASGNPSASLDVILGKVQAIVNAEIEAGRGGKSMWDAIKEKAWYGVANTLGTYFSVNDIIRYIGQGISTIRELDDAMTEVRKVSDATETSYAKFQQTIASTAKEIATTNKELLNSSADFLRLGYSLDQASDLAKNATLFVNVGDGVDITEATEDMITAMKAFDIQAEDSIKIVDDYNQIGNMFALSASDIGEAMKRSASALETGNNSFEQSIGLITAMNEIVQNSENTGNSLKVLSLRLRGAKAELESMSEDTDGLCESTSKLREQIQSLTGVDIMLDDNTFKSTTDIIKELGAAWDKLSDSSQAATLEIIAGKSRANNVAALLKNYQKIDEVMESLDSAEGSAMRENEAIVDSINGRIKVLSASVENFWQTLINSKVVKNVVSFVTSLVNSVTKLIDKVGVLPSLFTSIITILSIKNKNFGKWRKCAHFNISLLNCIKKPTLLKINNQEQGSTGLVILLEF